MAIRIPRNTVSTETFTITTHHVQVELADLLAQFDVTDRVVLLITTPSGRSKSVTLAGNFLAPQHHADDYEYPARTI